MRLVLGVMKFWQRRTKKWEVDSIFRLQEHYRVIVSWKLCLNLCSLRLLKPTRSLVSSFIPYMSTTLNTLFGIVLINLSKDFLNILYDSELRISKLNLFHSLIGQGKNELAKYSDLQNIWFNIITISSSIDTVAWKNIFVEIARGFISCNLIKSV